MSDLYKEFFEADSGLGLNSFNDYAGVGQLKPLINQSGIVPKPVKVEALEDNHANLSNLSQEVNPYQSYFLPPEEINHVNNVSSLTGPPKQPIDLGEDDLFAIKSDIETMSLFENYCNKHSEQEDLICFNCRSRICTGCMISEHDGHRTEDVEDVVEQLESIVKDFNHFKEFVQKLKKQTESIITKYQREIFRYKDKSHIRSVAKRYYMEDFRTFLIKRLEIEENLESETRKRIDSIKQPKSKDFINSIVETILAHSTFEKDRSRFRALSSTLERITKSLGGDFSEKELYLKNLESKITGKELEAAFKKFGKIKKADCSDWISSDGQKKTRVGSIIFNEPKAAQQALDDAFNDPDINSLFIHKTRFYIQFYRDKAIMQGFLSNQQRLKDQVDEMVRLSKASVSHPETRVNPSVSSQKLTIEILKAKFSEFLRLDVEDQRQLLGELLFPLIKAITGEKLVLKITGMLIDLSVFELPEIIEMLEDEALLKERVKEALEKSEELV